MGCIVRTLDAGSLVAFLQPHHAAAMTNLTPCPVWCTQRGHGENLHSAVVHSDQLAGVYLYADEDGQRAAVCLSTDRAETLSPGELRRLADAMVRAADLLDATA